ncbi:putative nuclease HARBI1 [Amyelois transitella]|uniref:putative nuclease HARBI1 n=1 Tax=Amyelois transitella TaxID=680683 RepID=UPI0029907806|nr:putative nuclease HARBI1 [Amyelois transitella]
MLGVYLDVLEASHEADVAEARASSRRANAALRQEILNVSEAQFRKRYRLSTDQYSKLVTEIEPYISTPLRTDGLDVETKILIALSFYATGSYQTPVGDSKFHPASQASVSKALEEVTVALNRPEIFHKYVKFPLSRHEREKVKRKFYRSTRLPGVLGCVDGTHVAIVTPHEHEERYFNRKGYHSLNVLILCDADLMIMSVDPSYPGATHDSKIWENHPLKGLMERLYEEEEDIYFLGDSGYPLRATLMTPIENALPGSPEAHYTSLHVSGRCCVERCIGVLKARFRCLLADRRRHYSPEKAARITNACCVLHNIAHAGGIEYEPLTEEEARRERQLTEGASPRAPPAPEDPASVARALRAGRERRHRLVNQLWRQRHILPR